MVIHRQHNSTLKVKMKECIICGKPKGWFSKKRCKECATSQDISEQDRLLAGQEDEESIRNLIEDLDIVYSKYIRLKNADANGIVQCVTCNNKDHYTKMDCGHFISRKDLMTRWNEYNTAPQCKTCNQFEYGKSKEFASYIDSLNEGMSDWLAEQAKTIWKPSREELKSMIIEYRHKLKLIKHGSINR